ncbi:MAG: hypothetical protein AAF725_13785 [Acidobacteriota bacterium]
MIAALARATLALPLAILALAPAASTGASQRFDLEADAVSLEIDSAAVEVRIDRDAPPSLTARLAPRARESQGQPEPSRGESAAAAPLLAQFSDGRLRFSASPALDARAGGRRLRVEIILSPGQSLELTGRELTLDLSDPVLPRDENALRRDDEDFAPAGVGRGSQDRGVEREEPRGQEQQAGESSEGESLEDLDFEDLDFEEADLEEAEADDEGAEEQSASDEDRDPPAWLEGYGVLTLRLEQSEVTAHGVRNLDLEAADSQTVLIETAGPLLATLVRGKLTSEEHQGDLDVLSTDAEAQFDGAAGTLKIDSLGGSIGSRRGTGQVQLKAREAAVRFEGQRGRLALDAHSGAVNLIEHHGFPVELRGRALEVRLEDFRALVKLECRETTLEVVGGRGQVQFDEASLVEARFEEFWGNILGTLESSELTVQGPEARLSVDMAGGRLLAQGLRQLELGGRGLEAEVSGVASVRKLEYTGGSLDLDLTELTHPANLAFSGQSSADITLAAPCVVKVGGSRSASGDGVSVVGCDLRSIDQTLRSAGALERYGRPPQQITLMLVGEPEIEVEGR